MERRFRFATQRLTFAGRGDLVESARTAEALGYDEFYSLDHIGNVDPFVPLMVVAEATETMRVGPLVSNNELHHPVLLARTAATVDRMTGGRLVLGLGAGYAQAELDAAGIELRPPATRVSRFEESVSVLRQLLDTGRATADGFHEVSIEDLGVTPAQDRVPFLIAARGRRMIDIAARHADIFQFTGIVHRADGTRSYTGFRLSDFAERSERIRRAAGERYDEIELSVVVLRSHVGRQADEQIGSVARELEVDGSLLEESPFLLFGSVDQVVEKLHRLREEHSVSHYVVRDPEGFAPIVAALSGR